MHAINDIITVPVTIHDSGKARIVGVENGADNWQAKKKTQGTLYYLSFGLGPWFLATEEELKTWGNV